MIVGDQVVVRTLAGDPERSDDDLRRYWFHILVPALAPPSSVRVTVVVNVPASHSCPALIVPLPIDADELWPSPPLTAYASVGAPYEQDSLSARTSPGSD